MFMLFNVEIQNYFGEVISEVSLSEEVRITSSFVVELEISIKVQNNAQG